MEKVPVVSVAMMTYNHEPFIRQAIEGVLMQRCSFSYELIIGEDCSTDGTRSVVEEYQRIYPHIIKPIFHQKNVGAIANQADVLNACRGRYIALCEGDDYWTDPLKLQKQVDFLEQNPDFAICFHDIKVVGPAEFINPLTAEHLKDRTLFSWDELLEQGNFIFTPSVVLRRKEGNFPFADLMPGDYFFYLWTGYGKKIFRMPLTMAAYRVHSGGSFSTKKQWSIERIVQHHLNLKTGYQRVKQIFPLNYHQKKLVYQHLFNAYNSLRFAYLFQHQYMKSAIVSWKALGCVFHTNPKSLKILISVLANAFFPWAFYGRVNEVWK